jgi:2-octaprenyl-3-methyl-6-methoxy-1,4-benzoquinol hydroxylase
MNEEFDVLIVGGGMVGATVACALGGSELKVGLVEQSMPEAFSAEQPHDMRVSALSIASKTILESVGAWKTVINMRSCPFKRMRVWETAGDTEFNSDAIGYDALGYIVENRVTQLALLRRAKEFSNVQLLCPASIKKIHYAAGRGSVELDDGRSLSAKVMVGADGGQSRVRQTVGLGVTSWDYQQHAMVINVETDYEQQDITWQRFVPTGPQAFLPLTGHYGSIVWYNTPDDVQRLKALPVADLLRILITVFHAPTDSKIVLEAMLSAETRIS